jgi:hypothetical protein
MQKDYITILKTILKEYAQTQRFSSERFIDFVNIKQNLSVQDVHDAMDELLEEIENHSEFNCLKESIHSWKRLLMDGQDVGVLFDLLID